MKAGQQAVNVTHLIVTEEVSAEFIQAAKNVGVTILTYDAVI